MVVPLLLLPLLATWLHDAVWPPRKKHPRERVFALRDRFEDLEKGRVFRPLVTHICGAHVPGQRSVFFVTRAHDTRRFLVQRCELERGIFRTWLLPELDGMRSNGLRWLYALDAARLVLVHWDRSSRIIRQYAIRCSTASQCAEVTGVRAYELPDNINRSDTLYVMGPFACGRILVVCGPAMVALPANIFAADPSPPLDLSDVYNQLRLTMRSHFQDASFGSNLFVLHGHAVYSCVLFQSPTRFLPGMLIGAQWAREAEGGVGEVRIVFRQLTGQAPSGLDVLPDRGGAIHVAHGHVVACFSPMFEHPAVVTLNKTVGVAVDACWHFLRRQVVRVDILHALYVTDIYAAFSALYASALAYFSRGYKTRVLVVDVPHARWAVTDVETHFDNRWSVAVDPDGAVTLFSSVHRREAIHVRSPFVPETLLNMAADAVAESAAKRGEK